MASGCDAVRIESESVEVRSLVPIGAVAGTIVRQVSGGACSAFRGRAYLRYQDGKLYFRANGSATYGAGVPVSEDGTVVVVDGEDPEAWARVEVVADYLPASPQERAIDLDQKFNNAVAGADVTAEEAAAGDVVDWTVAVCNDSGGPVDDVRAWLHGGTANLELSADGVDWYAPDAEDHADVIRLGTIAAAASGDLYLRRTIPAESEPSGRVTSAIKIGWTGLV